MSTDLHSVDEATLAVDLDGDVDLSPVFQPFAIRDVTLRNRIVRASQGTGLAVGGMVTDDLVAYNVARARGGVALSFADMGEVHWSSPGMLNLTTDAVIDGLLRLNTAVHNDGMKLFQQLLHGGPTNIPHDGSAPWAASPIPDTGLGMVCRPMTAWMIDEVVAGFASAAQRAVAGGIDGLEIHAGHGYLFSAFLSPATNQRTDDYGGPLENRARLLVEVLTAVRGATGPDYPVGVRLSADGPDDQTTKADIATLAEMLEARGLIDYLNLSHGSHYRRDLLMGATHEPHGYQLASYGDTARAAGLPTIVTGRIMTVAEAARIIAAGTADLVSIVRATIADPELVEKARTGRTGETKPCIACNQGCVGGLNLRGRVSCVVNPGAGESFASAMTTSLREPSRPPTCWSSAVGRRAWRPLARRRSQGTTSRSTRPASRSAASCGWPANLLPGPRSPRSSRSTNASSSASVSTCDWARRRASTRSWRPAPTSWCWRPDRCPDATGSRRGARPNHPTAGRQSTR